MSYPSAKCFRLTPIGDAFAVQAMGEDSRTVVATVGVYASRREAQREMQKALRAEQLFRKKAVNG